jgi:CelD/BcsL family acetyltransferase involved in cellulose biosynthesis
MVVVRNQLLTDRIPVISRSAGMIRYAPRQLPHYYTDLRGGPAQAFKNMSSKTRSTVQRKVRQFKAFCGGQVTWRVHRTAAEMLEFHRTAHELARKTYQERLFDSGLPATDAFRDRMLELAARDLVRGFLLFHGDRPIAYLYTPAPDGFLVYEYLGYDPEYAEHSPGTVLQYMALDILYAEARFPIYYWGYGYSQTKKIFATQEVLGADIFYIRSTLRNRMAVWLNYSFDRLSTEAGSVLNRLNLKAPIKRWLKGQ